MMGDGDGSEKFNSGHPNKDKRKRKRKRGRGNKEIRSFVLIFKMTLSLLFNFRVN